MSQRESEAGSARAPQWASSSPANSGMVMSFFSAKRERRNARCGSSLAWRRPPIGLGTVCVRTLHMTSGLDGFYRLPGPRQEVVEPIDGMSVDHALEHVDEIGVWLEAVELGGFDQGADDRPTFAAAVAAGKEMIL